MEFKTLLHIGYHKTGTSFLQKEVFVNEHISCNLINRDLVIKEIINKNLLFFDSAETLATLQENFLENQVNIISMENLVGNPHSGGYNAYDHFIKLKKLFPNTKILICIREQSSMILSTYKLYISTVGTLPLRKYLVQTDQGSNILPAFDLKHFCYHRLIETYMQAFGKENVLVLPYELLSTNPQEFLKQIFVFAGLCKEEIKHINFNKKRNVAALNFTLKVKRIYNLWFTRTRVNPHGMLALSTRINQPLFQGISFFERKLGKKFQKKGDKKQIKIINKVAGNFFAESNRKTMELTNIDLRAYNYQL